jgi:hypothetical protein
MMISYEFYKLIHLISIVIFAAGMGLMARMGFRHGEAFPGWVKIKIGLLFILNLLVWFSSVSLFQKYRKSFFLFMFCLLSTAIFVVVFKI